MKKIAFFCCALLALGFASCDEKPDLGTPQVNPQLPAVDASELQPALSSELASGAVDLASVAEIPAISNPAIENMPAGASVEYEMELATKADFSNAVALPVTDGKVSAAEWNAYYRETLGNNNTPMVNYVRFAAYFVQGTQRVRVGDLDNWYGTKQITVTPQAFAYEMATVNSDAGATQIANFSGDGKTFTGFVLIDSEYTFTYKGVTYGKKSSTALEAGSTTPCTVSTPALYLIEFVYEEEKACTFKASQIRSFGAIGDFNKNAKQVNLTQSGRVFKGEVDFGETLPESNQFRFRMNNNNGVVLGGFQYDLIPGGAMMDVPGEGVYELTVDLSKIPYVYSYTKK